MIIFKCLFVKFLEGEFCVSLLPFFLRLAIDDEVLPSFIATEGYG